MLLGFIPFLGFKKKKIETCFILFAKKKKKKKERKRKESMNICPENLLPLSTWSMNIIVVLLECEFNVIHF